MAVEPKARKTVRGKKKKSFAHLVTQQALGTPRSWVELDNKG